MTNFLLQIAKEHATKQIEEKSKRVYTGLDAETYEATEQILLNALDKGMVKSYKYHTYGYFVVEYN
ncbi:MAG: hypothetical protein ACI4VP_05685 [Clostridia bacterium]